MMEPTVVEEHLKTQITDAMRLLELIRLHLPVGPKREAEKLAEDVLSRARAMLREVSSLKD